MNAKLFVFTAALFGLAGCQSMGVQTMGAAEAQMADPKLCPQNVACEVKITVSDTGCQITADPDELHVQDGSQPNVILFKIDPPSSKWSFNSHNGIDFNLLGNPPNSGRVFSKGGNGGPKVFPVIDNNTFSGAKARWKYDINVTDGTTPCHKDPYIIND